MDWDKRNKISKFFGAEPIKYSFLDEMSWTHRNEMANKLTKGTCFGGIVGGVSSLTASAFVQEAAVADALATAGFVSGGVGLVMLIPTFLSYWNDDKTLAPLSMKGLVSLGIGAKNLVCAPFKAIKKAIEEHHNDYNNTYNGPYLD